MILNSPYISGSLTVTGNEVVTGSLTVLGGITGAITGSATSASYAFNASYLNNSGSGEFVPTGSFNAFSSSILTYTGSVNSQLSALQVTSGSNITRLSCLEVTSGSNITRISALESASGSAITRLSALEVTSGSNISRLSSLESRTGSYATTGSNTFVGNQTITGSIFGSGSLTINGCITATGQIVAQTINVQQVTSSIVYSCGSNTFGTALNNSQTFTGSMFITGSNVVANVGNFCVQGTITSVGNIGIGTPTPGQLIDAYKTSNDAIIKVTTCAAGAYFAADSIGTDGYYGLVLQNNGSDRWFIGSYGTADFTLLTSRSGGTEWLRINRSNGLACFGSTICAPAISFCCNANSGFTPVRLRNSNPGSSAFVELALFNDSANQSGIFYNSSTRSTDGGVCSLSIYNDATTGNIRIRTGNNIVLATGAPAADRLTINTSGNACFSGNVCVAGTLYVNSTSVFNSDMFTYNNGGIFFSGGGVYTTGIFQNATGLQLQTSTTPRLTITNAGIATFSCQVCAPYLFVNGTAGNIASDTACGDLIQLYGGNITGTNCGIGIGFTRQGSQLGFIKAARENAVDEASYMIFATQTAAGFHPERMRITSTGIACFACQVCAPGAVIGGQISVNAGNGNQLYLNNTGQRYTQITFDNNSTGATKGGLWWDNTTCFFEMYSSLNGGLRFYTGGDLTNSKLTITSGGIACFTCRVCAAGAVITGDICLGVGTGAYDQVMMCYSGFNGGSPLVTLMPTTVPGSGALTTYLFLRSNGLGLGNTGCNHMGLIAQSTTILAACNGSVGIGTTSPNELLSLGFADNSNSSIEFRSSTYARLALIKGENDASSSNGNLQFLTRNGGSITERMRITSGGNVGIGTNNPTGYTGANLVLHLNTSSTITDLKLTNGTTGTAALAGGLLRQDGRAMYLWNVENSFLSFGTNNGEAMRITNTGVSCFSNTICAPTVSIGGILPRASLHAYSGNAPTILQTGSQNYVMFGKVIQSYLGAATNIPLFIACPSSNSGIIVKIDVRGVNAVGNIAYTSTMYAFQYRIGGSLQATNVVTCPGVNLGNAGYNAGTLCWCNAASSAPVLIYSQPNSGYILEALDVYVTSRDSAEIYFCTNYVNAG